MPRFQTLTVTDVSNTLRDAVVVTLQPDNSDDFRFTQGQYLTFRREFDGVELRRSYSICSGQQDGTLQVGIKQVDGGVFSTWANTELNVGDTIEAMPPMGNFFDSHSASRKNESDSSPKHLLCFAIGSGITPILSILRTSLCEDPNQICTLVYANRSVNSIMFRNELEELKNTYMQRLNLVHVLNDDSQDIELLTGRMTSEKCSLLFAQLIDLNSVTCSYICGPEPVMQTISQSLKDHGVPEDNIRFELFASAQPGRAKAPAQSTHQSDQGLPAKVTLNGETRSFTMQRNTCLLDAALDNTLDAPFACRAGVCSTCKAKVLEGEVEMLTNHALEDYEVEAGYVLTCQCYPVSDVVVWDYDQAGH